MDPSNGSLQYSSSLHVQHSGRDYSANSVQIHAGIIQMAECATRSSYTHDSQRLHKLTLKLPGPVAGMGGSLTVTVA